MHSQWVTEMPGLQIASCSLFRGWLASALGGLLFVADRSCTSNNKYCAVRQSASVPSAVHAALSGIAEL